LADITTPLPASDVELRRAPRQIMRAAARAGAGGAFAVVGLHVALGGGWPW
jgi:hypothetical protein